eukprot:TRINITY_DN32626_c0_g1_i1.p1 TRINITY_DN32626_c0_g1~~TRINITY_DN32626_c0_g1_i1.p1  ORF type:complete len:308 (-),score=61.83 TRINITY_DN32626_c0_g1_i1:55-978(-)
MVNAGAWFGLVLLAASAITAATAAVVVVNSPGSDAESAPKVTAPQSRPALAENAENGLAPEQARQALDDAVEIARAIAMKHEPPEKGSRWGVSWRHKQQKKRKADSLALLRRAPSTDRESSLAGSANGKEEVAGLAELERRGEALQLSEARATAELDQLQRRIRADPDNVDYLQFKPGLMIVVGKVPWAEEPRCLASDGSKVYMEECYRGDVLLRPNHMKWKWNGSLLLNVGFDRCVEQPWHDAMSHGDEPIISMPCSGDANQRWSFDRFSRLKNNYESTLCMKATYMDDLVMTECDGGNAQWFSYY